MQYAAAALDSEPDIRQFVRDKTIDAKAILENMLMEMYKETAPAKQTDLDEKITKCRTTTVEEYILDALAILFNEEPFIKTFTLAVKNQAVIITHLYISVKPCITYIHICTCVIARRMEGTTRMMRLLLLQDPPQAFRWYG